MGGDRAFSCGYSAGQRAQRASIGLPCQRRVEVGDLACLSGQRAFHVTRTGGQLGDGRGVARGIADDLADVHPVGGVRRAVARRYRRDGLVQTLADAGDIVFYIGQVLIVGQGVGEDAVDLGIDSGDLGVNSGDRSA